MLNEKDIMLALHGSLRMIVKDSKYFYYSAAGPDYCHLTADGERTVLDIVNLFGARLILAESLADNERSKELMLKELKKV